MRDWRCGKCGKKLGVLKQDRLHLRLGRFEYMVGLPATTACHACRTLNELRNPSPRSITTATP
jgi:hypothetical protein